MIGMNRKDGIGPALPGTCGATLLGRIGQGNGGRRGTVAGVLLTLAALAGCAEREAEGREATAPNDAATIVDSIFPIEEEVRRFAEAVGPAPAALDSEWTSIDALVHDFVKAIASQDTALLARAIVTPAEFITFYFPHSPYTTPPYEMNPAIIWFQMESASSRGIGRALTRFGEADLELDRYLCDELVEQGPNLIRERCRVHVRLGDETREVRLFGPVMERDGRVKFLTYGNDL